MSRKSDGRLIGNQGSQETPQLTQKRLGLSLLALDLLTWGWSL